MLIIKIMGGDDTADTDARAQHRIIAGVLDVQFERRHEDSPIAKIWLHPDIVAEGETGQVVVPLFGNVYVMNDRGQTVTSFGVAPIISAEAAPAQADNRLDQLTERFLAWKLPDTFSPDGGISFNAPAIEAHWPSGTNLLDYRQASAMLAHVLGLQDRPASA